MPMTELTRRGQRARGPEGVRHGRLPRRRGSIAALKLVAVLAVVALVSVGSIAGYAVWDVARSIKTGVQLQALPGHTAIPQDIPNVGAIPGGVNLLLAG